MNKIQAFLALYERQGRKMRHKGRFDGAEEGVVLVAQWAGVSALFLPWAVFSALAEEGAFKVERMSPAAGGGLHLRPNKTNLKRALACHQGEFVELKLADVASKEWKAEHAAWADGKDKRLWNLGWYAEFRLFQHFGLDWTMSRNRRSKGVADIVLTDGDGNRHHWEVKDMIGAGFQIRPERANELGLDELCAD